MAQETASCHIGFLWKTVQSALNTLRKHVSARNSLSQHTCRLALAQRFMRVATKPVVLHATVNAPNCAMEARTGKDLDRNVSTRLQSCGIGRGSRRAYPVNDRGLFQGRLVHWSWLEAEDHGERTSQRRSVRTNRFHGAIISGSNREALRMCGSHTQEGCSVAARTDSGRDDYD